MKAFLSQNGCSCCTFLTDFYIFNPRAFWIPPITDQIWFGPFLIRWYHVVVFTSDSTGTLAGGRTRIFRQRTLKISHPNPCRHIAASSDPSQLSIKRSPEFDASADTNKVPFTEKQMECKRTSICQFLSIGQCLTLLEIVFNTLQMSWSWNISRRFLLLDYVGLCWTEGFKMTFVARLWKVTGLRKQSVYSPWQSRRCVPHSLNKSSKSCWVLRWIEDLQRTLRFVEFQ